MRKFLTALTLGTTVLFNLYVAPVAPAQAQASAYSHCARQPSGVTVKVIDRSTFICKSLFKGNEVFILYGITETSESFSASLMHIKNTGIHFVTIYEYKTSKAAQFELEGRKFKHWFPKYENINLLNKYRNFVTILLDAREEYHNNIPEF